MHLYHHDLANERYKPTSFFISTVFCLSVGIKTYSVVYNECFYFSFYNTHVHFVAKMNQYVEICCALCVKATVEDQTPASLEEGDSIVSGFVEISCNQNRWNITFILVHEQGLQEKHSRHNERHIDCYTSITCQ